MTSFTPQVKSERLECRYLLTSIGLDESFGIAGTVEPTDSEIRSGNLIFSDGASTYAERLDAHSVSYLYRYDPNGKVDTTWGDQGKVSLPFRPSHFAIDKHTHDIILGAVKTIDTHTLPAIELLRLSLDGTLAAGFGNQGLIEYTTPIALPSESSLSITLFRIFASSHGKLLLFCNQAVNTDHTDFGGSPYSTGTEDLIALQLRPDGKRDGSFGSHGVRVIDSGSNYGSFDQFDQSGFGTSPQFEDIVTDRATGFRIITSVKTDDYSSSEPFSNIDFSVKFCTMDIGGQVQAASDRKSWAIYHYVGESYTPFSYFSITDNGNGGILVFQKAFSSTTLDFKMLTFDGGIVSKKLPYDIDLEPTQLLKGLHGAFLIMTYFGAVEKYKPNMTVDRHWGRKGISDFPSTDSSFNDFQSTPDGKILGMDYSKIFRVDGTHPEHNSSPGTAQVINSDELYILGTDADDLITIGTNSKTLQTIVRIGSQPNLQFEYEAIAKIVVDTGSGNDRIESTEYAKPITVISGAGEDRITISFNSGTDSPKIYSGDGNDFIRILDNGNIQVNGGNGFDTLTLPPDIINEPDHIESIIRKGI